METIEDSDQAPPTGAELFGAYWLDSPVTTGGECRLCETLADVSPAECPRARSVGGWTRGLMLALAVACVVAAAASETVL
ncbi:hypothetical protein ABT390_05605 [Streptomyces aurantiacus]|uniref:Uncharacterized protein n=1 Tax=Streptomyces aurantiacus JA 4570 TaxID=1286094 RepID=S3ZMM1_9ACTN|nr:hypothetical protein [Streptomyces aurantiacus]EPH39595.1 hypothetical protein STRAU_7399 [Streptomyces aurantiacus JA 4570]